MIEEHFLTLLGRVRSHRSGVLLVIILLTLSSAVSIRWITFDASLRPLLPPDPSIHRVLDFLQQKRLAGQVAVSIACTDSGMDTATFLAAAEKFAGALQSPRLRRVSLSPPLMGPDEDLRFFVRNLPVFLSDSDRAEIVQNLSPEPLSLQLRRRYARLTRPEGSWVAATLRVDPLGWHERVLEKALRLSDAFGYAVSFHAGYWVSRDGRHVLLLYETAISPTDLTGSRELVTDLRQWISRRPAGLAVDVLCAHTHTVSNQNVMEADLRRTSLLESLVFLALFLVLFRSAAAVWIFLIPAAAVAFALTVCGWLNGGRLSAVAAGLSAVFAGIAMDYGNHVFIMTRNVPDPDRALAETLKPLLLGAAMTLMVFLSFLFSGISGYRQLGSLAIANILTALVYVLFVLPLLTRRAGVQAAAFLESVPSDHRPDRRSDRITVALFCLLLVMACVPALRVTFDSDVTRLDGTDRAIRDSEARFQAIWSRADRQRAFLVVEAQDREKAEANGEALSTELGRTIGASNVWSLASFWPSRTERERRWREWKALWTPARLHALETGLVACARSLGFVEETFAPFFRTLREQAQGASAGATDSHALLERMRERFVFPADGTVRAVVYFPDQAPFVAAAQRVAERHPHAFVVSARHLGETLSDAYRRAVGRVSAVGVTLIVLITVWGLREWRRCLLAFLPSAAGTVAVLAVLSLSGLHLTLANLMAGVVVLGLCMDFGVLLAHAYEQGNAASVRLALHMSAATMGVGAFVLLCARHPALFSVGLTLSIGILTGYLTAMVVLPALFRVLDGTRRPSASIPGHSPPNTEGELR